MTTRDTMVSRIADELGQVSGLDNQIVNAINSAIGAYQHKDFWFSSKRGQLTFNTTINQRDYDVDDSAQIPLIQKISFVKLTVSSQIIYDLEQIGQREMEELMVADASANVPDCYSYFDSTLWLHPKPAAAYAVRVVGVFAIAVPASGSETGNAWMTLGERLIRSRAKWELAVHTLEDMDLATRMKPAVDEALEQLNIQSALKARQSGGRVKAMEF